MCRPPSGPATPAPGTESQPGSGMFEVQLTRTGAMMGTPAYMAPEQFLGTATDARTDQFSLAVLAYTLLKNRPPFSGDTPVAILYQVVHCDPSPVGPFEGWDATPVELMSLKLMLAKGLSLEDVQRHL